MVFNWPQFLDRNHIEYVTSGPNVAKGHIACRCPFCGNRDPSQHMSISLDAKGWRCWRNPGHKGKHPAYLIQALLGCSLDHAYSMVNGVTNIPSDFQGMVNKYLKPDLVQPQKKPVLKLPKEFLPFREVPSSKLFIRYLWGRGFELEEILNFTKWYGLRYCTRGSFKGRIIFPVEYQGDLVCWTGRTVYDNQFLRYRTLSPDPEPDSPDPASIGSLPDYLLWYDQLMESDCDTIVLTEGPFDALKISILGFEYGFVATCFFTSAPSRSQVDFLHELLPRFKKRYLFLDRGSIGPTLRTMADLSGLGIEVVQSKIKIKDPGDLEFKQFKQIFLL